MVLARLRRRRSPWCCGSSSRPDGAGARRQHVVRRHLRPAGRHRRAAVLGRCSPRSRCSSGAPWPPSSRPFGPACPSPPSRGPATARSAPRRRARPRWPRDRGRDDDALGRPGAAPADRRDCNGSAGRLEGVLGVPATEGNAIEVLRNGDEIFPAMFDAIDAAERTDRLPHLRVLGGQIGAELADHLCARAKAGVRVRILLDGLRRPDDRPPAPRRHGRFGLRRPVVPSAAPPPPRGVEPPHPPQGPGRRRGRGVHRRRRHRRRVVGRRQERARVARHPLPHPRPGRRRPAGRLPRQLGRGHAPTCSTTSTASPSNRRPATSVVQVVRSASETGLERRRQPVPDAAAARPRTASASPRRTSCRTRS